MTNGTVECWSAEQAWGSEWGDGQAQARRPWPPRQSTFVKNIIMRML